VATESAVLHLTCCGSTWVESRTMPLILQSHKTEVQVIFGLLIWEGNLDWNNII